MSGEILVHVSSGETAVDEVGSDPAVGEDLDARLARGPLSVDETLALARRLAGEVAGIHARGVAHGRIGPRRVILPDGAVGRARLLPADDRGVGEPSYFSPEQARGDAAGPSADMFAIGALLFACLTGKGAFAGTSSTAVLARVLLEDTPRVSMIRNDIPDALDSLVARLLSKSPLDRPRDGADLAFELAVLDTSDNGYGMSEPTAPDTVAGRDRARIYVVLAAPGGAFTGTAGELGARVEAAVAPLGARVSLLVDGAALALLSGRGISADHAVKAARTALAMRSVLPGASVAAVTGAGVRVAEVPLGEMVERAARMLAQTSGAAAIVIDEDLAGLLDAPFVIGGDARGLLLEGEGDAPPASRPLGVEPGVLIGLESEIGALEALFRGAADEELGRVALIVGAQGAGKSRLVRELVDRIERRGEPVSLWIARGDPSRSSAPFALVADLLRAMTGIREGEPPTIQRQKLRGRVRRHVAPRHAGRVADHLAILAAIPAASSDDLARDDAPRSGTPARALEDLLSVECDARPVVVVLEDLHAADRASLDLLGKTAAALTERRFLLVALARPEVLERFPDLWEHERPAVIVLGPPHASSTVSP
ncbi:MAG: AAA family ATPase [Byssovorax sp.]